MRYVNVSTPLYGNENRIAPCMYRFSITVARSLFYIRLIVYSIGLEAIAGIIGLVIRNVNVFGDSD